MDKCRTFSQDDLRARRSMKVYLAFGTLIILVSLILIIPALTPSRDGGGIRPRSRNHLKVIGLAFHNYHADFGTLPDEVSGESWETQLLPYLDQAPLYNSMDHSQPWNDPANDPVTKQTVIYLTNPEYAKLFNASGYGLSHYAGNSQWLAPGKVLNFSGVTDGLSNTILAGEVGDGFMPWAQPGNLRDPSLGINTGLGCFGRPLNDGGALFLLGDGSVRFLSTDIDPAVLKALSTTVGGEVIPPDF